nr:PREDICTED: uncharacterized protein LOC102693000 [Lepisosteus oculatus]
MIMISEDLFGLLLLCVLQVGTGVNVPPGTFKTECRDRYFWVSVKSSFIGEMFRFDIMDGARVRSLTEQEAAECGFTVVFNTPGDLIFRASFLACHVESKGDEEFWLGFWFVNVDDFGWETSYPFQMTCQPRSPWKPREIVCEENYMEVSVRKDSPAITHQGLSRTKWAAVFPSVEQALMSEWKVVFQVSGRAEQSMSPSEARALGYYFNSTCSRVLFRCPYSTILSETLEDEGIPVETVRATVFYKRQWMLLMFDVTTACPQNEATFDGTRLSWAVPQVLSPLIQDRRWFRDRGARVGVEGRLLENLTVQDRGIELSVRNGLMEVWIPFGAEGGYVTSRVIDNQYNRIYDIDLFFVHLWEDERGELTQHRCFRPLSSPYIPYTPILTNDTVPAEQIFTIILGGFYLDVSLQNLTVGGEDLTLAQARNRGFEITVTAFPNDTQAFILKVPFTDPLVSQEYVGGGFRRYTLTFNTTLLVKPQGEVFFYPATVVCDLKDIVLPRFEGICLDAAVRVLMYYGNPAGRWEAYIGERRLDWDVVDRDCILERHKTHFSIEIPLFSSSMTYEDLSLQGVVAKVEVRLVDTETWAVASMFVHRCTFPVGELLVCMPDGVMMVLAELSDPRPRIDPRQTTLLDPDCKPEETDATRALFRFRVNACGTIQMVEKGFLIYENEVRYTQKLFPTLDPMINRDSEYRLTIRCRYPANDTRSLAFRRAFTPLPAATPGNQSEPFLRGQRRPRDVPILRARFATDETFSSFHSTYPIPVALWGHLYLELELTDHPASSDRLLLWDCWATETPEAKGEPRLDLLSNGCPQGGDAYKVRVLPSHSSENASGPSSRLEIQVLPPEGNSATWRQAYFHCSALLCDSAGSVCYRACSPGQSPDALSFSSPTAFVSAGPVQMVPAPVEKPLSPTVLLVGVLLASAGVLLLSAVGAAVRVRSRNAEHF